MSREETAPFIMKDGMAIPQSTMERELFVQLQATVNAIHSVTGKPPIKVDGTIGDLTARAVAAISVDYGQDQSGAEARRDVTPAFIAGQIASILAELTALAERLGAPPVDSFRSAPASSAPRRAPSGTASSTQAAAKTMLDKETNARFWAQTGYKVGQKLDPNNPSDRAMTKVWLDIYAKVKREDAAGKLVLTYNHPKVEQHLEDASVAHQATVHHLDAAANAGSAEDASANAKAASTAQQIGEQRRAAAAALQPPSVSPQVAQAAAEEAHAVAQVPPPNVVVFPPGHPVHWHPSAQAALPALAQKAMIDPAEQGTPTGAADNLALEQTASAAQKAGDAFQNAKPQGSIGSTTIANIREQATVLFAKSGQPFFGVLVTPTGDIQTNSFDSREQMYQWYETTSADPATFKYIAEFDREEIDGAPAADLFGGSAALEVKAQAPQIQVPGAAPFIKPKDNKALWIGLGIAGVLGVAAIAASSSKRSAPRRTGGVR